MALAPSCQPGHVAQESGKNQKDGSDETNRDNLTCIWKHAFVTTAVKEKSTLASLFDKCKWLEVGEGQKVFVVYLPLFRP